jgi:hypothetical protein
MEEARNSWSVLFVRAFGGKTTIAPLIIFHPATDRHFIFVHQKQISYRSSWWCMFLRWLWSVYFFADLDLVAGVQYDWMLSVWLCPTVNKILCFHVLR